MKVLVDSWAWLPKADLTDPQLYDLRTRLTIVPRKVGDHPGDDPSPLYLYREESERIAVPRGWFMHNRKETDLDLQMTLGRQGIFQENPVFFSGTLEPDQDRAVGILVDNLKQYSGGIFKADPGYGKTVIACNLIPRMGVPAVIVLHKRFLLNQWKARIRRFLPNARIGFCVQDKCDFEGKHIVLASAQSLYKRQYPNEFYEYFGLVITDETHRVAAPTWSLIPPKFRAAYRLGLTATPRRRDGSQEVFFKHIGPIICHGQIERLPCKISRIYCDTKLPESFHENPKLLSSTLATRFITRNPERNKKIVDMLIKAAQAGRRCLVMSTIRGKHLLPLETLFRKTWEKQVKTPLPTTSFYLGGMKESALDLAAEAQIIFTTAQMTKEALDIPPLDTLFLVAPMGDVEQAVGRIQRPFPGKKDPLVIDFRDDEVGPCGKMAGYRWEFYKSKGWVQ